MNFEMFNNIPVNDLKEIKDSLGDENNFRFESKTILILGGSGFLGTIFKIYFLYLNSKFFNKPCKIISCDNYIGRDKPKEIEDPNLIHIQHDLTIPMTLKLWDQTIDFIINCSGHASPMGVGGYERFPIETIDTGSVATKNILELALQHNASIVLFSSSEVLGTPPDSEIPSKETSIARICSTNKRSCYDAVKLLLEVLGWNFRQKYAVDVKTVRLFNCVGYFNLYTDKRVVPNFMLKALNNEQMTVYAPGTQTRTLSFFTDVVAGVLLVLLNGEDYLYHIGQDKDEISMVELAQKIEKVCGKIGLVSVVEAPQVYEGEPKRRMPNIDKIRHELGFNPKVGIDEMLKRIYDYYNYQEHLGEQY